MSDPILTEVHEAREALARENDYDLQKIVAALRKQGQMAGRQYVDLSELKATASEADSNAA